jgi:adenylate kinase family enzyme
LPVVHLDRLFWKPGWIEADRAEWKEVNRRLLEGERWIIEGEYRSTMEGRCAAADAIVFLDLPFSVCAVRTIRRRRCVELRPDLSRGWSSSAGSASNYRSCGRSCNTAIRGVSAFSN